jgi:hypothetical protein
MAFIEAFIDELTKTGAAESVIRQLGEKLPGFARAAAVGVPAGMVGHALGKRKGEREGIEEGTTLTGDVAKKAYRAGVQRGAEAMRDAMVQASQGGNTK